MASKKIVQVLFCTSLGFSLYSASSAEAATISWGAWTLGAPIVTKTTHANGNGTSAPNKLTVIAGAAVIPWDPGSYLSESATVFINASSYFTVNADPGELYGQSINGSLFGDLTGTQFATGFDIFELTGSYSASVQATVNAGFASWTNPGPGSSISGSVLILDAITNKVNFPFNVPGVMQVGQTYPFSMELTTNTQKSGAYQVISKFQDSFNANVRVSAVPGPLPILGVAAAFGFSRKLRKRIKLHRGSSSVSTPPVA